MDRKLNNLINIYVARQLGHPEEMPGLGILLLFSLPLTTKISFLNHPVTQQQTHFMKKLSIYF